MSEIKTVADGLNKLADTLNEIEACEQRLAHLKESLVPIIADVADVTPDEQRHSLMSMLYFEIGAVPADDIKAAFGFTRYNVKPEPMDTGIPCQGCEETLIAASRNELEKLERAQRRGGVLCADCSRHQQQARIAANVADNEERERRLHELKTMPYKLYLQTPEWKQRRSRMLRSTQNRCQLCNCGNTELHVHHRTYEYRGEERFADLIVLCEPCHAKFHGKLPKEPQP